MMRSAVNPAKLNNANKLILLLDKQWAGCALMWKWTLLSDSGALQHSGSHSSSIQNYWQDCNEKALCETGCSDTDRTVINSDLLTAASYKTAQQLAAHANKDAIISRSVCIHATDALTHITNTEMMDGWEVINIQSRTAGMSHPPLARCDSNFSLSVPFFFFFVSSCRIFSASSFTPLPSLALLALAKQWRMQTQPLKYRSPFLLRCTPRFHWPTSSPGHSRQSQPLCTRVLAARGKK